MKFVLMSLVFTLTWSMAQEALPISEARALELGSTVTISGTVTVPSGAFASSIASGFAVQDDNAGIYVADDGVTSLPVGIEVTVTGTLEEANAQLFIQPESVTILPAMASLLPMTLMTGDVSEASEGSLVYVSGEVTRLEDDTPWGYKVYIDDGSGETQVFINLTTDIDTSQFTVGQTVSAVGFSGQYDAQYEVMPRSSTDVAVR